MELDATQASATSEETNEAVETSNTVPTEGDDLKAQAAAAAETAMAKEPGQEEDPHQAAVKAGAESAEPESKEAKLKIYMRAKQYAQKTKEQADAQARQMREQAQQELAEAQRLKSEYESTRQTLAKLRTKPNEAIRELGLHGKEFWEASLAEGEPDPVQGVNKTVEELKADLEAQKQEIAQWKHQQEMQRHQVAVRNEQTTLLSHIANTKDAYPTLNAIYGQAGVERLVKHAYEVAADFHARTGQYPLHEDVAEYLEYEEAEKYKRIENLRQAAGGERRPAQSKRANGSRTLSGSVSTERATAAKPFEQLSDDEKVALARQAAEKAMREWNGRGPA